MSAPCVIFDAGPLAGGSAFRAPLRVIRAETPEAVPGALDEMAAAQAAGFWLAGCASYELGYVFSSKLREAMPGDRAVPLLQFGVFGAPEGDVALNGGAAELGAFVPDWSFEDYAAAFGVLHGEIARGEIYQGNLTFGMSAAWSGSCSS